MKKFTKTINIEYIIECDESLKEWFHSFIELSWNHMIPIVSAVAIGDTGNYLYLIGIVLPLLFQIKLNNEDDER